MTDPVVSAIVRSAAKAAVAKCLSLLPSPQRDLDRVRDELVREAAFETEAALNQFMMEQFATNQDVAVQLADKVSKRDVAALYLQLYPVAITAAPRERMRMMCRAIAGIFSPDLEIENKSRVVRAVQMLEPSDVLLLRRVVTLDNDARSRVFYFERTASPAVHQSCVALVQAGCVVEWGNGGSSYRPTEIAPLAHDLLKFLEHWTPETDLPLGGEAPK